MNDIKAREEQKAESSELSQRLREQRPMFEKMLKETVGNRFYLN